MNIAPILTDGVKGANCGIDNETIYKKSDFVEVLLTGHHNFILILYAGVCVSGLIGNGSVIFIIFNFSKMKTVTNFYILNLAVADVMFLIGIPFLITTMALQGWPFGNAMCKAYWITANVNQFVSSMFCLVLSGDRFVAVYLALSVGRKYRRPHIARYVCAGVWIFALLIMIPVMRNAKTVIISKNPTTGVNVYSCQIVWPEYTALMSLKGMTNGTGKAGRFVFDPNKAFTFYTFAFGYGIPVVLTAFFYFMVVYRLKSNAITYSASTSRAMVERSTLPSVSGLNSHEIPSSNNNLLNNLNLSNPNNMTAESNCDPAKFESVVACKNEDILITKFSLKRGSFKSLVKIPRISLLKRSSTSYPESYLSIPKPKLIKTPSIVQSSLIRRRKKGVRRVTNMVLIVIAVYVCSWTPYWVLQLILSFRNTAIPPKTVYASMFIYCLAYANSSMNPILYAFLSNSFKNCFKKMFVCKCFTSRETLFPSMWRPNCMKKRIDRPSKLDNRFNKTLVHIPIIVEGATIISDHIEVEAMFHAANIDDICTTTLNVS